MLHVLAMTTGLLLSACGGAGPYDDTGTSQGNTGTAGAAGSSGSAGLSALLAMRSEAAGANCANGGTRIDAGADKDRDGTLSATEVTSTQYVCNGAAGATGSSGTPGAPGAAGTPGSAGTAGMTVLTNLRNELSGTHCTFGGVAIDVGLDSNGNRVLDAFEVSSTGYVCNGSSSDVWINADVQALPNYGYIAYNAAAQVVVTLPNNLSIGETVRVRGNGQGGWKIAQNPGQKILITTDLGAPAHSIWWSAPAPRQAYRAIAMSADAKKLVVAASSTSAGGLYTSADGGLTWAQRDQARMWTGVASSADGSKLAAVVSAGYLYTSTDSGATWTQRDASRSWKAVASSADGSKLVASVLGGYLYTSTDSGATWTQRDASRNWRQVTSSADGTRLAAIGDGLIHVSTDSGVTWQARGPLLPWASIASSSDGMKLVAGSNGGSTAGSEEKVYVSSDGGQTWTPQLYDGTWLAVAISSDGNTILAGSLLGPLALSADSGATWRDLSLSTQWGVSGFMAISSDGSTIMTTAGEDQFYRSTNSTTQGTAGSITGAASDSIELVYLGDGVFDVRSHVGSPVPH